MWPKMMKAKIERDFLSQTVIQVWSLGNSALQIEVPVSDVMDRERDLEWIEDAYEEWKRDCYDREGMCG